LKSSTTSTIEIQLPTMAATIAMTGGTPAMTPMNAPP
jgi:hypothetical protein